jgi:hypothetical protein
MKFDHSTRLILSSFIWTVCQKRPTTTLREYVELILEKLQITVSTT